MNYQQTTKEKEAQLIVDAHYLVQRAHPRNYFPIKVLEAKKAMDRLMDKFGVTEQPEVEGWLQTEGKDGKDNLSLS